MSVLSQVKMMNIVPTMRCNLRCRLCDALAPYFRSPYHPPMEWLQRQADRYFSVIPSTRHFVISGGEALVREDLHLWVRYLSQFASQIERLDLNTNGTMIPQDNLLNSMADYPGQVRVLVDDYGPEVSKKADEAYTAFAALGGRVHVERRDYYTQNAHHGGWVDFGVYDLMTMKTKTPEEAAENHNTCSTPRKLGYAAMMIDGILYHCWRQYYLIQYGAIPRLPEEAVDFFDPSLRTDELRARVGRLLSGGMVHQTCKYCNGLHENAPVRFRPAEQMSLTEQHQAWEKNEVWREVNGM